MFNNGVVGVEALCTYSSPVNVTIRCCGLAWSFDNIHYYNRGNYTTSPGIGMKK
ncbi:MAG: hypothetical protein N2712_02595 [Brevinematales bacterium]|nr:hypothetical protein [Brevinematales bacterium]